MICVDWDDSVASVQIQAAAGSNSLTETTLHDLSAVFASLTSNRVVQTIVLSGRPEAFMAGVDQEFFARSVLADLDRILKFTRTAHALLACIAASSKQVVAWVRGPAYGAGLELALACHRIVASPGAKFSFPETGLGIYPGMGGTQRTPRRIGIGLAKWMIATGAIVPAPHALEIGLVDAVPSNAETAFDAWQCINGHAPEKRPLSARFRSIEELFGRNRLAALCDLSFPTPQDAHLVRLLVQLRSKAPLALRMVEQIIDRGMQLPLEKGIEEEFSHLREVFSTEDARVGLTSSAPSRPDFKGR